MKKHFTPVVAILLCLTLLAFAGTTFANTETAVSGIMGDVDGSGAVSAADAAKILRTLTGAETSTEDSYILADVNHDNMLSAADAAQVLRYLAGLEAKLETIVEKQIDEFSFIAENNAATLTVFHGTCPLVFVPSAMERHPVTALKAGLFSGTDVEVIVFQGLPPEGILDAGISEGANIQVLPVYMEEWVIALGGDTGYVLTELGDTPVYFSVSLPDAAVYNGAAHPIGVTPWNTSVAYEVSYQRGGNTVAAPINAGEYTYTITVTEPGYVAVGKVTGSFSIEKATHDMSGVSFVDLEKNIGANPASEPYHTITITGTLPEGVSVEYYYQPNGTSGAWVIFPGSRAAGTFYVKAVFTVDEENYHTIADMFATLKLDDGWTGGGWNSRGDEDS